MLRFLYHKKKQDTNYHCRQPFFTGTGIIQFEEFLNLNQNRNHFHNKENYFLPNELYLDSVQVLQLKRLIRTRFQFDFNSTLANNNEITDRTLNSVIGTWMVPVCGLPYIPDCRALLRTPRSAGDRSGTCCGRRQHSNEREDGPCPTKSKY